MILTKMKVDQLRSELKSRGLGTAGTKPLLLARLQAALDAEVSRSSTEAPADPATQSTMDHVVQVGNLPSYNEPTLSEVQTIADAPKIAGVSCKPPVQEPTTKGLVEAAQNGRTVETEGGGGEDVGIGIDGSRDGGGGNAGEVVALMGGAECLSMEQRVAARSTRFGGTDEGRRAARVMRFGLDKSEDEVASIENATACSLNGTAYFGKRKASVPTTPHALVSPEEQARREKRAKRFAR